MKLRTRISIVWLVMIFTGTTFIFIFKEFLLGIIVYICAIVSFLVNKVLIIDFFKKALNLKNGSKLQINPKKYINEALDSRKLNHEIACENDNKIARIAFEKGLQASLDTLKANLSYFEFRRIKRIIKKQLEHD